MTETALGSEVWRLFSPEDIRALRLAAGRALIRMGAHPEQLTERELDKWIESRVPTTLEKYAKHYKDKGLT